MTDHESPRLPTPQEMIAKRQERLDAAFTPEQRRYLPEAMRHQLEAMTKDTYPANAVEFLTTRVSILEKSQLPPDVFAVERSSLPQHLGRADFEYPVIDLLSTAYPGGTSVPIKQLAMIERDKKSQSIRGMDPLLRRQMAQQGMLEHERTMTRLNPKGADSNLLSASRVEHIFGVIRAAERCYDSTLKTDLFQRTIHHRFDRRIANYEEAMQKKYGAPSDGAVALQELSDPANLTLLQEHIHQTAGAWVREKFPPGGEMRFLQTPTIEQCLEIFDSDIFWFADWPDKDIQKLIADFSAQLPEYIQGTVLFNDESRKSISGFAESAFPSKRAARHIEMYTGTPLKEMVAEQVRIAITEDISITSEIIVDTLRGGEIPMAIKGIVDEMIATLKKMDVRKQQPETTPTAVEQTSKSNVVDLAAYRTKQEEKFKVAPHTTVVENLKFLLETIIDKVEFTPPEFRARYFGICQTLDRAYIQSVFQTDRHTLAMPDIYGLYRGKGRSVFYDIYRLTNFVLGDEATSLRTIHELIDENMLKMNDSEFAQLYDRFFTQDASGSFFKHTVAVKKERTLYEKTSTTRRAPPTPTLKEYMNILPQTRERLERLLTEQPNLFSTELQTAYSRWVQKQEKK